MSSVDEATFACSSCGRSFRWKPDLAGRKVKCKCGATLTVPLVAPVQRTAASRPKPKAPSKPEPEVNPLGDWLDTLKASEEVAAVQPQQMQTLQPSPKSKKSKSKPAKQSTSMQVQQAQPWGLKIAGYGLILHFTGFALFIGSLFLLPVLAFLGPLAVIPSIVTLCGFLLFFFAPLLALAAPNDAGRPILVIALVLYVLVPVVTIAGLIGIWTNTDRQSLMSESLGLMIVLGVILLMLCGTGFLLGFLKQLAAYLNQDYLYAKAESVITHYKFQLTSYFLISLIALIPSESVPFRIFMAVIGACWSLLNLLLFGRYLTLCLRLGLVMRRN